MLLIATLAACLGGQIAAARNCAFPLAGLVDSLSSAAPPSAGRYQLLLAAAFVTQVPSQVLFHSLFFPWVPQEGRWGQEVHVAKGLEIALRIVILLYTNKSIESSSLLNV